MKKFYNYTFQLVCIYILVLSFFSISNFEIKIDHYDRKVYNVNQEKILGSVVLAKSHQEVKNKEEETLPEESIKEVEESSTDNQTEKEEVKIEETVTEKKESIQETINIVDTSNFTVLSQETVNISHYGHDCYGCSSGHTASGYYIGDGRIYYQDATFGSVRVVAADSKYPLGSILRLSYQGSTITAIVLDRGGGIGDGKKFQIDLLESSEAQANSRSIVSGSQLEVLRLGY